MALRKLRVSLTRKREKQHKQKNHHGHAREVLLDGGHERKVYLLGIKPLLQFEMQAMLRQGK